MRTTAPSNLVLFNFWQEGFNQGIIAEAESQTLFCAQPGDCTADLESRHSAVHDEDGFDEFCECFQIGGTCF